MENNGKKFFSEGILLAAIPFLGYLTVFVYELGFSSYFGIPYEFIQPSFTGVCLVTAIIIGVLLFGFVFGHCFSVVLLTIFPIKDGPFLRAIRRITWQVFVLIFFVFFWGKEWKEYIGTLTIFILIISFEFLWPLITCRDRKNYNEKLAGQEEIEKRFEPEFRRFFDYINGKFGRFNVSIFLIASLFLLFVYQAGLIKAKQREYFWQLEGDQKIVIRIYGDNLICGDFDVDKHVLNGNFNIVKLSPEKKLSLKMTKVGRLKSTALPVTIMMLRH